LPPGKNCLASLT